MKTLKELNIEKMNRWEEQLENGICCDYYDEIIDDYDRLEMEYWEEVESELVLSEDRDIRRICECHNRDAYKEKKRYLGYYISGLDIEDVIEEERNTIKSIDRQWRG